MRLVNGFFATYLQRPADPASEQALVAALQSGLLSPEAVGERVLSSEEYYRLKDK